jgi:hypothetical protein
MSTPVRSPIQAPLNCERRPMLRIDGAYLYDLRAAFDALRTLPLDSTTRVQAFFACHQAREKIEQLLFQ